MSVLPLYPKAPVSQLRSCLKGSRAGSSWLLLTQSRCSAQSSLTSDKEITSHNEHQADGGQHEASAVSVVLIAHKTDAAHRVPIHLQEEGVGGQSWVTFSLSQVCPTWVPTLYQSLDLGHGEDCHSEDKGE